LRTRKHRLRLLVVAAALGAALLCPATAGANWWSWGFNYLTPNTQYPYLCKFPQGEVCGEVGRATPPDWYGLQCRKNSGGKIHCGWERPDTWVQRGVFMTGADTRYVTVVDTGWQGSGTWVQPEATWWEGNSSYMRTDANPGGP
jgi:hypothetical protein